MSATEADDIKEVIAQTFVAIGTLARALHIDDARLQPTLDAITAHAAAAHPAAKDAGLILLRGGKAYSSGHDREGAPGAGHKTAGNGTRPLH
jgi:hypothetical protein